MNRREDDIPFVLPAHDVPTARRVRPAEEVLRPGRQRGFAAFGQGLAAPCRGFVYMAERPSLWPYGLVPVLLNLLISVGLVVGLWYGIGALQDRLDAYFAGLFGSGVFGRILHGVSMFAAVVAAWGVALLLTVAAWYLLQGVLCDYFYRKLAVRVEVQLGSRREELTDVPFLADLLDTCLALAALVFFNVCFLFLNCLPVVGSFLALACSVYFSCWVFGIDFLSLPLSLRGLRRWERLTFAREHRGQTLGLGVVVFGCNLLPVVNAVLLTSAVVGAVLLHREVRPCGTLSEEEVLEVLPAQPRRR
jgi:uncharacterized protein involved in cysteine biosynthesis